MNPALRDLALRAFHTFWQTFTAVFGGLYVASGLDVTQVVDVDSGKRFLAGVVAAAGAAALSATKTVVKSFERAGAGSDDPETVARLNTLLDA